MQSTWRTSLVLDADNERLLALLAVVYGRPLPSRRVMHYVSRASEHWRRGDKVMAQIELAFAQFPRLETKSDAFRLFLAEDLLAEGFSPRRLMRRLGFDLKLLKFDEDEPRDPATGRWVRIGADESQEDASSAQTALQFPWGASKVSLLGRVAPLVIEGLETLITRATAATVFFGTLLIPTPNPGGVFEGEVPGLGGVRYRYDGPMGLILLSVAFDNGKTVTVVGLRAPGNLCVDKNGNVLGRFLTNGACLDTDAVVHALKSEIESEQRDKSNTETKLPAPSDDPKLCPNPSPDRQGSQNKIFDIAYPEYVNEEIVNPGFPPLPPGLGFRLVNPLTGDDVVFDGCQYATGRMQEYKGHYADLVEKEFYKDNILKEDFLEQARRQVQANAALNARTGRHNPVDWRFDEPETAGYVWDTFRKAGLLGGTQIRVHYTPYKEGTDEEYPDPED
jgi:hypothetical protein